MLTEAPMDWQQTTIGQVASLNDESLSSKTPAYYEFKYVSIEDVSTGSINGYTSLAFAEAPSRARRIAKRGDILLSTVRPYLKSFTRVTGNNNDLVVSTGFAVLRAGNQINPTYLYQLIFSEPFIEHLKGLMTGSNYPAVKPKDIASYPFPLPPLNEQQRIAEILSSVDASIQATQAVIDQAERVKKGLMEELLTGGLGSAAIERGEVPEGWKSSSIGALTELQNGYGFKSKDWAQDGLPIIRIQNLNGGGDFNYFNGEYDEKYLVQKGDLLFCWSGSRGTSFGARYWTQEKGLLNQHIFKCIPKEGVEKAFLYYLLDWMTVGIEKEAHGGAGLAHIKKSEMIAFSCCMPPISEQQRIAEILSDSDDFIAKQKSINKQKKRIKQGLMDDLLTGKVRTV